MLEAKTDPFSQHEAPSRGRAAPYRSSTETVGAAALALVLALSFFIAGCPAEAEDAPPPIEPGEVEPECEEDDDCDDRDPCTATTCFEGFCYRERVDAEPRILTTISTEGSAMDVHLSSTRWLQVAAAEGGIETYDLSPLPEEEAPLERRRPTHAPATGVTTFQDHVIALMGSAGIEAFPFGEDESVSVYRTIGPVRDVTGASDLLIAAMGSAGLEVIDYSDTSSPSRYSRVDTAGRAERVIRYRSALHVADGLGGVAFIDFNDRDEPVLLPERRRPTDGRVMAVRIRSPLYMLAELGAGVGIIDMDEPDVDRLSTIQVGGHANDLDALSVHTAVVAAGSGGLVVLDLLNPEKPIISSRVALDGPAMRLSRSGERIAVAMEDSGVAVIDLQCTVDE